MAFDDEKPPAGTPPAGPGAPAGSGERGTAGRWLALGNLRFKAPAAFRVARSRPDVLLVAPGPSAGEALWVQGPLPAWSSDPAANLDRALRRWFGGREVLRREPPQPPQTSPSQLASASTRRIYRFGGGELRASHTVVRVYGNLYLVTAYARSIEGFRSLVSGPAAMLLRSVEPFAPTVSPSGSARGAATPCFGGEVALPTGWKTGPARASGDGWSFEVPVAGSPPVAPLRGRLVVRLGRPRDPEASLRRFVTGPLAQEVLVAEKGRFSPYRVFAWATAREGRGSALGVTHLTGKRVDGYLAGQLLSRGAVTVLAGIVCEVGGTDGPVDQRRRKALDRSLVELGFALVSAKLASPPRVPEREAWLAKKGSYAYRQTSSSGSPATVWVVRERMQRWEFRADGTCTHEARGYFGVTSRSHDDPYDPYRTTGSYGASRPDIARRRTLRYEVRGAAGGALFLVARDEATGVGELHRLEPQKRAAYGPYRPEGLALDGEVEGTYREQGGVRTYEAP